MVHGDHGQSFDESQNQKMALTLIGRGERILTVLYSLSRGNSFGDGTLYVGLNPIPPEKTKLNAFPY